MAARVAHFEIHAADPQRAINFYTRVLGWEFNQWGDQPYWLIKTGPAETPGIDGGLLPRHGDGPLDGQAVNAYVCTVIIESLEACTEAVLAHGGTLALPRMAVPGIGWLAYFKDTEGNIFGAVQNDPEAK
jgi:hypothetical protein